MTTRLSRVKKKKQEKDETVTLYTTVTQVRLIESLIGHKRYPRYLQLFWTLLWVNQHWVEMTQIVVMCECLCAIDPPPPPPFYM